MLENYISIQDIVAITGILAILIKLYQLFGMAKK